MEEKELLARAKAGDNDAFNQLIANYKPYIKSLARKYFLIGGDGEDIFQEALIGFFQAVNKYDESNSATFKTFATLCMSREIQTVISRSHNNKNRALNEAVGVEEDYEEEDGWSYLLISDELTPEESLLKKQKIKAVINYIRKEFTEEEKIILNAYLNNRSYAEIGVRVGRNAKYVDNSLSKIKKKLSNIRKKEDL